MKFMSPTHGVYETTETLINHIIEKIKANPLSEWTIAVGTDSQNNGTKTKFCSAILLIEKGNGGNYFYSTSLCPKIKVIQQRLFREAELSIKLGKEMLKIFEQKLESEVFDEYDYNIHFEIHCDFGHNGKSKNSIQAAIGWITSEFNGLVETKIKPNSPAASQVADKYTK